jgi:hypothetical protein
VGLIGNSEQILDTPPRVATGGQVFSRRFGIARQIRFGREVWYSDSSIDITTSDS